MTDNMTEDVVKTDDISITELNGESKYSSVIMGTVVDESKVYIATDAEDMDSIDIDQPLSEYARSTIHENDLNIIFYMEKGIETHKTILFAEIQKVTQFKAQSLLNFHRATLTQFTAAHQLKILYIRSTVYESKTNFIDIYNKFSKVVNALKINCNKALYAFDVVVPSTKDLLHKNKPVNEIECKLGEIVLDAYKIQLELITDCKKLQEMLSHIDTLFVKLNLLIKHYRSFKKNIITIAKIKEKLMLLKEMKNKT